MFQYRQRPARRPAARPGGVAAVLLTVAMAVAVVMDGATTSQIQSPDSLSAFVRTLLVHAVAAAIGVGASAHAPLRRHVSVSAADKAGLRFGTAALFALLAVGGILVTVRLILNWGQVTALFDGGYDFDGYLGLGVLSVLYLPNLIVGAAAILGDLEGRAMPEKAEGALVCHYCDRREPLIRPCKSCRSTAMKPYGAGTERVAEAVLEAAPDARVLRLGVEIGDRALRDDGPRSDSVGVAFCAEAEERAALRVAARGASAWWALAVWPMD